MIDVGSATCHAHAGGIGTGAGRLLKMPQVRMRHSAARLRCGETRSGGSGGGEIVRIVRGISAEKMGR